MIKYIKPEDQKVLGETLRSILSGPAKDGIYRCAGYHSNDVLIFNTVNQGVKGMFIDADGRGFGDVFDKRSREVFFDQWFDKLFIYIGSAQITVIRE